MLTILDALRDEALFGAAFAGPTWDPWRVALAATFGLPLSPEQLATFQAHTGRETPPTKAAKEWIAVVGRRGGKSRIAAAVAVGPLREGAS